MKEILNNKKLLGIVLIAMMIGAIVGWLAKSSTNENGLENEVHEHSATEEWTCSMHPQIRQSEPGQCPLCGMALIPVSTNAGNGNPLAYEMTPEAMALANIHTTRVTGSDGNGQLMLTGKVKPNEQMTASITAKFPGRIEQLFVNFTGQEVKAGQKLATIYSPELVTAQKELLEAAATQKSFPELYQSARQKLKGWKLNDTQIDAILSSGKVSDRFDVHSDKSGVVTTRNVSVGDYVNVGSVLLDVVDLSKIWIILDAYESDLPSLKTGNEVNFTVAGLPGERFKANITFIDPVVNNQTRTAAVRVEIKNANGQLRPEMFVSATVQTARKSGSNSLTIPRTALLWSGKRSIVYVKIPDAATPQFEMREITIGARSGEFYEVLEGLTAGEEIVTNGVFSLDAAAQLAGKPSMMNPKGGSSMTGHHHGSTSDGIGSEQLQVNSSDKEFESDKAFRNQIKSVFESYLPVKDALIASDPAKAAASARLLLQSLDKVDMKLVKGAAHMEWMKDLEVLKTAATAIQKGDDLETMRMMLSPLSDQLYHTIKKFKVETSGFRQFCPMAMNNKGAFWLSDSDKILNPYFGDAMLTCGNVEEELK